MVMELVDGEPLSELVRRGIPPAEALRLVADAAEALAAAHEREILHRDIKGDNLMRTRDGRIKVLDFGLAKLRDEPQFAEQTVGPTRALTGEGRILGTVAYMSPEQAKGQELDSRTDLFSFGAVLYEMSTGKSPFRGNTSALIFKGILDEVQTPAARLNPDVPHRLEDVINKALEKDRDLRYQHASDMRSDLMRLRRESESGRAAAPEVVAHGTPQAVVASQVDGGARNGSAHRNSDACCLVETVSHSERSVRFSGGAPFH
jgi:serine/threonine protein kinase